MTINWISRRCIPAFALATLMWTTAAAAQGQPMMPMMPGGAAQSRPLQPMEMLNLSDARRAMWQSMRNSMLSGHGAMPW